MRHFIIFAAIIALLACTASPLTAHPLINQPHSMKLFDPTTETEFDIQFCWPSVSKRKALSVIQEQYVGEVTRLTGEYQDTYALRELSEAERAEHIKSNPALAVRGAEFSTLLQSLSDYTTLRVCQTALSPAGLTTHQSELIRSDCNGDFWTEQDWGVCSDIADRFRKACQSGRRADQVLPRVEDHPSEATVSAGPGAGRTATEPATVDTPTNS